MQDQAKKALESALGGKKTEFEKWDKEIKKREEAGGGGNGGGGWWRRWFGGSDGEHFWHEAQQVSLTLLALAVMVNFLSIYFYILVTISHLHQRLFQVVATCIMEFSIHLACYNLRLLLLLQLLIYVHDSMYPLLLPLCRIL